MRGVILGILKGELKFRGVGKREPRWGGREGEIFGIHVFLVAGEQKRGIYGRLDWNWKMENGKSEVYCLRFIIMQG